MMSSSSSSCPPRCFTVSKCCWTTCCCGCIPQDLRTGSLIIGWLLLITDIIFLQFSILLGLSTGMTGLSIASWIEIVITLIHLLISILLITGISYNKMKLVKSFVYTNTVLHVVNGIIYIAGFILVCMNLSGGGVFYSPYQYMLSQILTPLILIVSSLGASICYALSIYFTVVVASYARSFKVLPEQPGQHEEIMIY